MTTPLTAELLPCPFCKEPPSHVECMDLGLLGIEHKYAVICYCGAQGPEAVGQRPEKVEAKAAKLWNRRVPRWTEAECRAAFEEWFENDSMPLEHSNWFKRDADGDYTISPVANAWDTWSACARAAGCLK